jgi:hypothetical protein
MYIEKKLLVFSILIGLGITLLSSVLINNVVIGEFPDIRFVSIPMLGVSYWGYPLPWMKQVVYPGAVKEPIWSHLVINVAYWAFLVSLVELLYLRKARFKEKVAKRVESISKVPAKRLAKRLARKRVQKLRPKKKVKAPRRVRRRR